MIFENQIIGIISGCNGQRVTILSILIDKYNSMVTSCHNNNLYFYNSDFVLVSDLQVPSSGYSIGYDAEPRFVIVSDDKISLYDFSF